MNDDRDMTAESAFELGTDGPRSIVVGVDGSEASMRAGAYAAGMARRQGCRLTVAYVQAFELGAGAAFDDTGGLVQVSIEEFDAVEKELRGQLGSYAYEIDVVIDVRRGSKLQTLCQIAEDARAELIVVGSSRSGAFLRSGGPLSVQLVKTGRWPVVVVP